MLVPVIVVVPPPGAKLNIETPADSGTTAVDGVVRHCLEVPAKVSNLTIRERKDPQDPDA